MTLDLLSKLNTSDHLATIFQRYREDRQSNVSVIGGPDSIEKDESTDSASNTAGPSLLQQRMPHLYGPPEEQSPTDQRRTEEFRRALERIDRYRMKLIKELHHENSPSADDSSSGDLPNEVALHKLTEQLTTELDEARQVLASLEPVMHQCQALRDINGSLLPELVTREQHLKLYKLLREVIDAGRTLDAFCPALKRDYQKSPLETVLNQVTGTRKAMHRIVFAFNVFLRTEMPPTNPIHRHMYQLTNQWKDRLEELGEELFVWVFESVKWPAITLEDVSTAEHRVDHKHMTLFGQLFRLLLELQTGDFRPDDGPLEDNRVRQLDLFHPSAELTAAKGHLPLKLMAVPLIKRFNYYFMNEHSKLNNIENPEWFLCQVEQWITRNEHFLSRNVDPILAEYYGEECKSSVFQLTCHLLELVKQKLDTDANKLTDDRLFSTTLDEVIIFNKQINFLVPAIYEMNPALNPIQLFFEDDYYFGRFLTLEKNRLNEFVESIVESETSWNVIYGADFTEENPFIICEAADKFSLLLQNLIERSTFIPSNEYRVRIVDLIVDTMDDFRLRLSQMVNSYDELWPFSKRFYGILNTFGFLVALINEWRNSSYFLQILHDNHRDQSVFANLVKTFEHMIESIFQRLENSIIADVTLDIFEYKKLNWHGMSLDDDDEFTPLTVSKPGATLIYNISVKQAVIQKAVSSVLFHSFLYDLSSKVQDLFFDRIILEHYFNRDGARQLQHDIRHGLFTIFALYLRNTEYIFAKLSDALVILNCRSETIRNLKSRYQTDKEAQFKAALRAIGVYSLRPNTVMAVIEKRITFH